MTFKPHVLSCLVLLALALSACTTSAPVSRSGGRTVQKGTYKVGNPYKVGGKWYYPEENFRFVETGIASWYGPTFHGKKTANGEIYNQNDMTAAHRTLQMPSIVRVTNLENGKSVIVRVNDRGPYLRSRVIDVSQRAAELLGFIGKGTARVRVEALEQHSRRIAEAAKQGRDTSRMTMAELEAPDTGAVMPASFVARGPEIASLAPTDATMMPESLQTPTITVEELSAPGRPQIAGTLPAATSLVAAPAVQAHVDTEGRYMPDAVVAAVQPVRPTGIFVQAGAFSMLDNAEKLRQKLSAIERAQIETVTAADGRRMYRVKLGPVPTVAQADMVLEQVIRAGQSGARVIR